MQLLNEVTVTSKKPSYEVHTDKIVFNVDKSPAAAGNSAFDVLRRAPGVSIDADENLQLKGSTNVVVLLDGVRTYLTGQQLSNLLKGMNADQLSKIEVSSTPGVSNDASGNAGVINVVTKKDIAQGYA